MKNNEKDFASFTDEKLTAILKSQSFPLEENEQDQIEEILRSRGYEIKYIDKPNEAEQENKSNDTSNKLIPVRILSSASLIGGIYFMLVVGNNTVGFALMLAYFVIKIITWTMLENS